MTTTSSLAREIAKHLGITGKAGGWLYQHGQPICQGWFAFEQRCIRRGWIVDRGAPFAPHVNWRRVPDAGGAFYERRSIRRSG